MKSPTDRPRAHSRGRWAEGRSPAESYNGAGAAVRLASRAGGDGDLADEPRQQPRLDDNGDGEGTEQLVDFGLDGQLSQRTFLGVGRPVTGLAVTEVTETATLPQGQNSAVLWAPLGEGTPLGEPWVTVRPPSDRVLPVDVPLQGTLRSGLNLIALPVVPAGIATARALLAELASQGANALRMARLDTVNQSWQEYDALAGGTDFPISGNEGYALALQGPADVILTGAPSPDTVSLLQGVNLVGFPLETGARAFELLAQLGGDTVAVTVAGYDLDTARYVTAAYDDEGQPVGTDFTILRGCADYITLRVDLPGFELR